MRLREKRIKCFIDILGTVDELGRDGNKKAEEEFFGNLVEMEKAYGAVADISFVTAYSHDEASEDFTQLLKVFGDAGMSNRITVCRNSETLILPSGVWERACYVGAKKYKMMRELAREEKDLGNILFCLYAGDSRNDFEMALCHSQGHVPEFKNIPAAFIDASEEGKSFTFQNGRNRALELRCDDGNYRLLSEGMRAVTKQCKLQSSTKISIDKEC